MGSAQPKMKMKRWKRNFGLLLFCLYGFQVSAEEKHSAEIYKWVGEDGRTHYSTKPRSPYDQPANLPSIQHENLDVKIKDVKGKTPPNCEAHGGVDCTQGADKDGSVICRDGFKEAIVAFRLNCMEADLHAEALQVVTSGEKILSLGKVKQDTPITELQVSVRNNSDVEAKDIKVRVRFGVKQPVEFNGPEKIESYGLAEYQLPYEKLNPAPYLLELKKSEVSVYCSNCR